MADPAALTFAFMRSHPADAARVLEGAAVTEIVELLARVPARIGSGVVAEMLPRSAADVLSAMPEERAFEFLANLDAQRAVAILRHVASEQRTRYLTAMPTATALTAKLLLEFIDDAVGSCMNPDIVALTDTVAVDVALDRVRGTQATVDRIYVVDDTRHLLGFAPLTALLRAPPGARLESLAQPSQARLPAHTPLAGARAHPGWQSASSLPVVDSQGRLLGEISRDALERAAQRMRPSEQMDTSLVAVVAHGYWQSLSGILELLTSLLPASRPIGPPRNEH